MVNSLGLEAFLTQFHFIRPLWLLALIPMLLLLWLHWRQESKPSWNAFLPTHLREALILGERGWRKQLPLKLLAVTVTVAIVICAGPSWQRQASPFGEDKASLLVILDNSNSMLQKDLAPNRLERAKQKIRDLLTMREGGNTGLIVYAGSAHIAMPLTQDRQVFEPFLAAITPQIMPLAGKSAHQALPFIEQQLSNKPGSTVLLVSDGVSPATITAYENYFTDRPHQLLILAVGNSDRLSDSPLDLNSLENLASATAGYVVKVTVNNRDIATLNRYIERNVQLNSDSAMPWQDMGYKLLLPLAIMMLFWFRKGWLVQWCVVIMLCHFGTPLVMATTVSVTSANSESTPQISAWDKAGQWWWDLWLTPQQQGQRQFNQGYYLQAAKHFVDPLRKGTAYYYAAEYKLAHSAFLEMQNDPSPQVRDNGLYNAASALARLQEYVAARDLLQSLADKKTLNETLRLDVEHNLKVVSDIVNEINQMSASQVNTADGTDTIFELGEDHPQTADGADEQLDRERVHKETLNAKQILHDQQLADKWLKRVEADPKYFLRAKFQIQLREQGRKQEEHTP